MVSDTSFLIDKVDSCLSHGCCEVGEVNWLFKYPLSSIFDLNQWAWDILYKNEAHIIISNQVLLFWGDGAASYIRGLQVSSQS